MNTTEKILSNLQGALKLAEGMFEHEFIATCIKGAIKQLEGHVVVPKGFPNIKYDGEMVAIPPELIGGPRFKPEFYVPEGYVMVPLEPTENDLRAIENAMCGDECGNAWIDTKEAHRNLISQYIKATK